MTWTAGLFEKIRDTFKRVTFMKIWWSLAYVLSFVGLSYYTRESYIRWNIRPDIATYVRLKPIHEFPSPAVAICAPKVIRSELANFTDAYLIHQRTGRVPVLSASQWNYMSVVFEMCGELDYAGRGIKTTKKSIYELMAEGYPDIKTSCSYRNLDIDCRKILNPIFTEFGICQSFNMQGYNTIFNAGTLSDNFDWYKRRSIAKVLNPALDGFNETVDDNELPRWSLESGYLDQSRDTSPVRASPDSLLRFSFAMSQTEAYDLCPRRKSRFLLIIHLPNEVPTDNHDKIFFDIGKHTSVAVETKSYRKHSDMIKFGAQHRECYFKGEKKLRFFKSYTKGNCDLECWTNLTLSVCGCVHFAMPRVNATRVCEWFERDCHINSKIMWSMQINESALSNAPCDCYPPCSDLQYRVTCKEATENKKNDAKGQQKDADKNTVVTTVSLRTPSHFIEERESFVSYSLQNFVADCGGLVGLFMGWSFISVASLVKKLFRRTTRGN